MHSNKLQKLVACSLLAIQLLMLPGLALAQIGDVPTSNSALGLGGIGGYTANSLATGILEGANKSNSACLVPEKAFFAGDKGVSIGMGGLALISGGASVQEQLIAKITKIEGFKGCHGAQLEIVKAVLAPNTFISNRKQLLIDEITKQIMSLEAREEPLLNQLKVAQQGFWKTLVWNVLIKTTKTISINMVNKMVKNYKINNFSKYADAVATQVYDSEFILDNFSGAKADQMLVRSFLANPALQGQMSPSVLRYTNNALGFDPKQLNTNDPNFYQKMYSAGTGGSNPFVQQIAFANSAQMIHSKSLVTAQAEIAQSSGLKTPRNCQGVMSQQKSLDQSYKLVDNQLANRQALFDDLVNAKKMGYPVTDSDLSKAQTDLAKAQNQWDALPNSVESPIVKICEGIVSPPSLINKGIDQAFNALGQNVGTYNNNNLPFFITFITDVANKITNDMIFGGGVSGSSILQENIGNLSRATSLVTSGVQANLEVTQGKNITITSSLDDVSSDGKSATFSLQWDASGVGNATAISISGPGVPANINGAMQPKLSGAVAITVAVGAQYTYTVTAYGKSKADVLATLTKKVDATRTAVTPPPPVTTPPAAATVQCEEEYGSLDACIEHPGNDPAWCASICGSVNGAFISKAPLSTRGPMSELHPRGE